MSLNFIKNINPVKFTWNSRPLKIKKYNEVTGEEEYEEHEGLKNIDDIGFTAQNLTRCSINGSIYSSWIS